MTHLKLLEYLVQKDGSVVCKWCGEVLPSRSRWYRHKYKLHVQTNAPVQQSCTQAQLGCIQPAPLFKCHSCNAYFKSRKGYIGHLSSRHSGEENDENREEACNAPAKTAANTTVTKTLSSHQKKITDVSFLLWILVGFSKYLVVRLFLYLPSSASWNNPSKHSPFKRADSEAYKQSTS